jgi:tripartite ATP-independent transporter DctP family solute receptor
MRKVGMLSMAICLSVMLLLPGAALAGTVKFTFATTNSPKDFSSQAVMRWQKAMKKASNGELDMTFIPGGALGGDKQLLQQLSANEVQLHVAGPVVVHHLVREYQCMEAEFVYKDEAHGFRVWTGPLGKEVSRKLESQYNITIVGVGSRGARNVTSNVPVRKPADMKGIKIRITNPLRQAIFKAFGALPAPLSIKEVYGALRQGVFEAQENPVSTIWGHKFYEVQKYVNLTGHVWSYWVISANKKFMDSLSSGHRKIFTDTLDDAVAWLNKTVPSETNTLLKKMEKKGVTVIKPDIAAFQKIAAPIVRKFASEKCRPGLLDDIAKYK